MCGSALGRPLRAAHPCRAPARPTRQSPCGSALGRPPRAIHPGRAQPGQRGSSLAALSRVADYGRFILAGRQPGQQGIPRAALPWVAHYGRLILAGRQPGQRGSLRAAQSRIERLRGSARPHDVPGRDQPRACARPLFSLPPAAQVCRVRVCRTLIQCATHSRTAIRVIEPV